MGSFRDEINAIRFDINSPPSISQEQVEKSKEKCKPYIVKFCSEIKSHIMEQARNNGIRHDFKRSIWGKYTARNFYYETSWSFAYKFDKKTSFDWQSIYFYDEDGGSNKYGIVTNSADLIIYIIEEVARRLAKDEIYHIRHDSFADYSNTYVTDILPKSQQEKIQAYFLDYKKVSPTPMGFYCHFAYFIEPN